MDTLTTERESSNVISSDKVEGTTVYGTSGDKLGSISELMIDKQSGKVRYAVLKFGGLLGIGTESYPLPWEMLKYDTSKDGYTVPVDKSMLDDAPRYSDDKTPDWNADYGREVHAHYGTPWSEDPLT
jgi:sporulation protein YlmC with PRC-barrel domain